MCEPWRSRSIFTIRAAVNFGVSRNNALISSVNTVSVELRGSTDKAGPLSVRRYLRIVFFEWPVSRAMDLIDSPCARARTRMFSQSCKEMTPKDASFVAFCVDTQSFGRGVRYSVMGVNSCFRQGGQLVATVSTQSGRISGFVRTCLRRFLR